MKHHATAVWSGPGREGNGVLTTESKTLDEHLYSFDSRFGNAPGTNPEELLAAAHASCYTMKLSFVLGEAGYVPNIIRTTSYVSLTNGAITESHLIVKADVPKISKALFESCIKDAEANSPLSMVLKARIRVEYELT
ncbi:OsmC family peroxiredoxin [Chitinophaga sp. CF418]|uniref:OsmC family peroxiredoxin n=1 Tax=Chitinophaga sp. CF418 TaxID=1855287 RepID=UPI000918FBAA|nr:OsmC family peroxiredoxin [Chitinophaga sp. CF418]SHM85685.1 osmotically inducible protein OsmC [Chitinophaga sp. CF418]